MIGRPYSEDEANETARLMTVDAIADALFKADLEAGKVKEEQREDLHFFTENYLSKAHAPGEGGAGQPGEVQKEAGRSGASAGPSAGDVRFR